MFNDKNKKATKEQKDASFDAQKPLNETINGLNQDEINEGFEEPLEGSHPLPPLSVEEQKADEDYWNRFEGEGKKLDHKFLDLKTLPKNEKLKFILLRMETLPDVDKITGEQTTREAAILQNRDGEELTTTQAVLVNNLGRIPAEDLPCPVSFSIGSEMKKSPKGKYYDIQNLVSYN